jgi:hypothetical protein
MIDGRLTVEGRLVDVGRPHHERDAGPLQDLLPAGGARSQDQRAHMYIPPFTFSTCPVM